MTWMRRRPVSAVLVLVLALGACGGDGGDDDPGAAASTTTTARSATTTMDAGGTAVQLGNGGVDPGTYETPVGDRTATFTVGTGWTSLANPEGFELFRGTRGSATEQMSLMRLTMTAEALLASVRAAAPVEVTEVGAAELAGLPARRYEFRNPSDSARLLFEVDGTGYQLPARSRDVAWVAVDGEGVLVAIVEGLEANMGRFLPMAEAVVASLDLSA